MHVSAIVWRMKEEEKQQKFHEALLKILYPSPPSPQIQPDEGEEKKLIHLLNDLPPEEEKIEEGCILPSSSDGENGGDEKPTRAQRKRLRKKKLKEATSRRRKIIGPLLPDSSDVPEGVRQNAATNFSGEPVSCSKQNKLKQRRKSKKSSGGDGKVNSSSIETSTTSPI